MSEKRRIVGRTVGTPLSLDKIKEINLREFPDDELHRTVSEDEKAEWNKKVKSVNGKEANELGAVSLSATDVGAEQIGQTARVVGMHNANTSAHNDIRLLIAELGERLNAIADSSDVDLDQLSELVAYIKSNRTLIQSVTTNKVNVSDIVNNLTTNVSNKPLSAAQGVELKALLDALTALVGTLPEETNATSLAEYIYLIALDCRDFDSNQYEQIKNLQDKKLDKIELTNAVNNALAQAKSSGEFDGVGVLGVHQTVTSTADGGTNVMTMGLTDGKSYTFTVKNGTKGSAGKSAYQYAQDGGYTGTEEEFAAKMASENTGYGSVQSDLTQNDETAPDYVKGRTHWVESEVLLPETTIALDENSEYIIASDLTFKVGKTYKVNYCGTNYTCVGLYTEGLFHIGNPNIFNSDLEDNGIPFASTTVDGFLVWITFDAESEITVSISTETVHQIDPKFVPNLPYSEYAETTLIDNATLGSDPTSNPMYFFTLVEGQEYKAIVNGVEYTEMAVTENNGEMDVTYIGNGGALGFADNGKPYTVSHVAALGITMALMEAEEGTLTLTTRGEIVHQLPMKFIVDSLPYIVYLKPNPDTGGFMIGETPDFLKSVLKSGRLIILRFVSNDGINDVIGEFHFAGYSKTEALEVFDFKDFDLSGYRLKVNDSGGFDVEMLTT